MLSLMNVIFELPFSELMEQLHVHPLIQAAIESHDGPLGTLLAAAEAIEIQDEAVLKQTLERWPSLERSTLAELQMSAERWIDRWTADHHRPGIGIQT
jgi:EAL and modified HD-GYP domain-containing signal transduction protein